MDNISSNGKLSAGMVKVPISFLVVMYVILVRHITDYSLLNLGRKQETIFHRHWLKSFSTRSITALTKMQFPSSGIPIGRVSLKWTKDFSELVISKLLVTKPLMEYIVMIKSITCWLKSQFKKKVSKVMHKLCIK